MRYVDQAPVTGIETVFAILDLEMRNPVTGEHLSRWNSAPSAGILVDAPEDDDIVCPKHSSWVCKRGCTECK